MINDLWLSSLKALIWRSCVTVLLPWKAGVMSFNSTFPEIAGGGRDFWIHKNHKPLIHALSARQDRYSPKKVHYSNYIFLFTTDIHYLLEVGKVVSDALWCPDVNTLFSCLYLTKLMTFQQAAACLLDPCLSSEFMQSPSPCFPDTFSGDWLSGSLRPFLPSIYGSAYLIISIHILSMIFTLQANSLPLTYFGSVGILI